MTTVSMFVNFNRRLVDIYIYKLPMFHSFFYGKTNFLWFCTSGNFCDVSGILNTLFKLLLFLGGQQTSCSRNNNQQFESTVDGVKSLWVSYESKRTTWKYCYCNAKKAWRTNPAAETETWWGSFIKGLSGKTYLSLENILDRLGIRNYYSLVRLVLA